MTANPPPVFRSSGERTSGIALIVVLGLLAVVALLMVAFSIYSRTERVASRAYADVMKARQLTLSALNLIMAEELGEALTNRVYPTEDIFTSDGEGTVNLIGGKSTDQPSAFIPKHFWPALYATNAPASGWRELRDANTNFWGEYAFVAVNLAGLLDANEVGGRAGVPRRGMGYQPAEIGLNANVLSRDVHPGGATNFLTYRNQFGRFETGPEFEQLASETNFSAVLGAPPLLSNYHFTTYSRFPLGYAEPDLTVNTNIAYIGGDPVEWDTNTILNILSEFDVIPDKEAFLRVMQDYASTGYVFAGSSPEEQFSRISSKAFPMINEVVVNSSYNMLPGNRMKHFVYIDIELWRPNPTGSSDAYVVSFPNPGDRLFDFILSPNVYPSLWRDNKYGYPTNNLLLQFKDGSQYATNRMIFEDVALKVGTENPLQARITIKQPLHLHLASQTNLLIDAIMGTNWPTLRVNWIPSATIYSLSANDPRINWDPSNHFNLTGDTLEANNNDLDGPQDELLTMHARHGPLQSAGELGYLLFSTNKPWTTLRLGPPYPDNYPAELIKLFDRFTVHPPEAYPRRGLVNPNSRQTNVLAALFHDTPVGAGPDEASTRLDAEQALNLARSLITNGLAMTNLSDVVAGFDAGVLEAIVSGAATNKFMRESVLRNSMGLLSPRQQLYAVLVAARSFVEGYDPDDEGIFAERDDYVASEQRAVAVVWRDPYRAPPPGGSGQPPVHETFIHYFHWLTHPED